MREFRTARFIEGADRRQVALLPESLDDYVGADNPVRVVDAFVDALDLAKLGFDGVAPEATGRPGYHPATLLKIYLYGYLNQVQSSRGRMSIVRTPAGLASHGSNPMSDAAGRLRRFGPVHMTPGYPFNGRSCS
jgi:hypothetical protein